MNIIDDKYIFKSVRKIGKEKLKGKICPAMI